ncbi:MAG TPA: NADH-quinone oxidoreductase subunit J [Roseiflexaceae bacterium]|nr:NADH-quinone oxidoreductase subunit J [Roseiflexaceae bacterium]
MITVIFVILAFFILAAAVMVVTVRNIIHAALWLIATFFAIGALYLLLEAEFLGVAQILIYVGAISILILFAVMLTRDIDHADEQIATRRWRFGLAGAAAFFGLLLAPMAFGFPWFAATQVPVLAATPQIGTAFMREYLLPFQLAAIVLLVALVGAVVIAIDEQGRRRVLTLAESVARDRRATAGRRDTGDAGEATEGS